MKTEEPCEDCPYPKGYSCVLCKISDMDNQLPSNKKKARAK